VAFNQNKPHLSSDWYWVRVGLGLEEMWGERKHRGNPLYAMKQMQDTVGSYFYVRSMNICCRSKAEREERRLVLTSTWFDILLQVSSWSLGFATFILTILKKRESTRSARYCCFLFC